MMDIFTTYPLYALIASNAVLVFGAAIAVLRFERLVKRNQSFWDGPTGTAVRAENNSDAVLSGFLERRLAMLHEQIEILTKQKVTDTTIQPAELPFKYAARMVKHGASVEDLIRTSGLNKAEAQLMWHLHTHRVTKDSNTLVDTVIN